MDKKIAVQQLAEGLANRQYVEKKNAELFVRTVFETIADVLTSEKLVKIKGFGTFKMIEVSDRESVNVNTGERIIIAGHPKVTFTPDPILRDQVNKPFAAFETVIINDGVDIATMESVPEQPAETPVADADVTAVEEQTVTETPTTSEEVAAPVATEEKPVVKDISTTVTETPSAEEPAAEYPVKEELTSTETTTSKEPAEKVVNAAEQPVEEKPVEVVAPQEPVTEVITPTENQILQAQASNETPVVEEVTANVAPATTPIVEGIIEASEEDKMTNTTPQKKGCNWAIHLVYILLILIVTVAAYYAGTKHLLCTLSPQCTTTEQVEPEKTVEEPEQTQPVSNSVPEQKTEPAAQPKKQTVDPNIPQMENGEYIITGTKAVHTFAVGDNLWKLAKEYYGDRNLAPYIILYNQFPNPDNIFEGTEVKIPELKKKTD